MATYVNDLRLKEIATGDEAGTWGTSTNTNLELIAEAFSFGTEAITTNANTHTTTIADGSTDPGRSIFLKYTGALDSDCTITIGPNTVSKLWFIENATTDSGSSGPYNIIIKQGTGATVTVPNSHVKAIYSDGAGSGGAMVEALTDLNLTDSLTISGSTPTLTIGDAGAEDTKIVFDGNAQDFYIGLDDSADDLVIGKGSAVGTTPAIEIDENLDIKFAESIGVGQAASSTTGDITAQTMSLKGTTPTLTIGDAGEEDTKIVFDGNAQDYYIALDDSADDLVIGLGSTVGTTPALSVDENQLATFHAGVTLTGTTPTLTIGDAGAEDTKIVFDGNAQDFYIGLDDSADDLVIGLGSTVGTTPAIEIDENQDIKFAQSIGVGQAASSTTGDIVAQTMSLKGTTPTLTIGDADAEDTKIVFDGNAQDFYVGLDDSTDDLTIGVGSTVGTTPAIIINENQQVGIGVAPTHAFNLQTTGTGEARFRSSDGDMQLQISSDADETHDSVLGFVSGTSNRGSITYDHNTTAASQSMIFKTGDNAISAMTLNGVGQMQMQAATPSIQLTDTDNNADAFIQGTDGNLRFFADDNQEASDTLTVFSQDGSETMRIDTNGRLNLGAVAHFADINQAILNCFINSSTIPVCRFAQGSTTTTVPVIRCRHENSSNGFYIDFRTDENATTGTIKDVSGTMTYASASDSRLKNDVETIPEGLTEVLAMNPVKFTWDAKKGGGESRGFLAQELNSQYSWAVQEGGDDPYQDPWQADYGKLTPVLVKAVQELKAELDAAKARITTLESA